MEKKESREKLSVLVVLAAPSGEQSHFFHFFLSPSSILLGTSLVIVNLAFDGCTNAMQDQVCLCAFGLRAFVRARSVSGAWGLCVSFPVSI